MNALEERLREARLGLAAAWFGSIWGAVWFAWGAHQTWRYAQEGSLWWVFYLVVGVMHAVIMERSARGVPYFRGVKDALENPVANLGGAVDGESCPVCHHPLAAHLLVQTPESPADSGLLYCPAKHCTCVAGWRAGPDTINPNI